MFFEGGPASQILDPAKREQADLIAMSSRGLGEVSGLLAVSATYNINHVAPCSCLVVS